MREFSEERNSEEKMRNEWVQREFMLFSGMLF